VHYIVLCPYAVNSADTLNQANRIPVDVVVNHHIAILKVQPFGQDIGTDKVVDRGLPRLNVLRVCFGSEPINDVHW